MSVRLLRKPQPPLTEQIQILEHALKTKLFERSRQGARLTPAGAANLPAVRKFAEQLGQLELAVHEAVSGQAGVLTIGAITQAMIDVLPPLIDRFKAEHLQITVAVREIDSAEAITALESGDIDLAFARLEGNLGKNIRSLPLTEDRLAVAIPRDHPLAARTRLTLANLVDEPMVMSSRQVSPNYFDYLIGVCKAHGLSPRVLHEVRSVTSQIAFVSCGQGVALVPASMKKLAPDNVILKPLTPRLSVVTAAVVWNGARANPLVEALLALLPADAK